MADIIKMYRQILVDLHQTKFQRILWRTDTDSNVNTYELNTITYGTAPVSYLATRCLKRLVEIYAERFLMESKHVQRDFYMDDLLTGADKIEDVKLVHGEVM